MENFAKEAKVLQEQISLDNAYLPLGIVASPIVSSVLLVLSVLANIFLLPFVILYQLFSYFFPDTASQTLKVFSVYYEGILLFALRIRETIRVFLMTNLSKPTTYEGRKVEPFYADLIELSPNAHEYVNPKQLGDEFAKHFSALMPESLAAKGKVKAKK